jgi:hypothetical protein
MEDIINQLNGKVEIIFEYVDTENTNLTYRDLILLSSDEYSTMTQDDIDAIKQERINNWLSLINPTS